MSSDDAYGGKNHDGEGALPGAVDDVVRASPRLRYHVPEWVNGAPRVFPAMIAVLRALYAVEKTRDNKDQHYKFRGIDDVFNSLHPALADAGLLVVPVTLQRVALTPRATKNGGSMIHTAVEMEFHFTADDGSSCIVGPVWGESLDTSDKTTNKCMSFALKYAALITFTIPTKDIAEADEVQPETTGEYREEKTQHRQQEQRQPEQHEAPKAKPEMAIGKEKANQVYDSFGVFGVTEQMLIAKLGGRIERLPESKLEELRKWKDEIKANRGAVVRIFGQPPSQAANAGASTAANASTQNS